MLVSGVSGVSGTVGADLDYTLRAFPNHHRALFAMSKYQLRKGQGKATYTADCYFDRAVRFKPDDAVAWMLYGIDDYQRGNRESALEKYQKALLIDAQLIEAQYNIGLLYVELGKYEEAQELARKVYARGFPLDGLKNRLQALGYWSTTEGAKDGSEVD